MTINKPKPRSSKFSNSESKKTNQVPSKLQEWIKEEISPFDVITDINGHQNAHPTFSNNTLQKICKPGLVPIWEFLIENVSSPRKVNQYRKILSRLPQPQNNTSLATKILLLEENISNVKKHISAVEWRSRQLSTQVNTLVEKKRQISSNILKTRAACQLKKAYREDIYDFIRILNEYEKLLQKSNRSKSNMGENTYSRDILEENIRELLEILKKFSNENKQDTRKAIKELIKQNDSEIILSILSNEAKKSIKELQQRISKVNIASDAKKLRLTYENSEVKDGIEPKNGIRKIQALIQSHQARQIDRFVQIKQLQLQRFELSEKVGHILNRLDADICDISENDTLFKNAIRETLLAKVESHALKGVQEKLYQECNSYEQRRQDLIQQEDLLSDTLNKIHQNESLLSRRKLHLHELIKGNMTLKIKQKKQQDFIVQYIHKKIQPLRKEMISTSFCAKDMVLKELQAFKKVNLALTQCYENSNVPRSRMGISRNLDDPAIFSIKTIFSYPPYQSIEKLIEKLCELKVQALIANGTHAEFTNMWKRQEGALKNLGEKWLTLCNNFEQRQNMDFIKLCNFIKDMACCQDELLLKKESQILKDKLDIAVEAVEYYNEINVLYQERERLFNKNLTELCVWEEKTFEALADQLHALNVQYQMKLKMSI